MTEIIQPQQVIVPYDFSPACENALLFGLELARMFSCEVSLMGFLSDNTDESDVTKQRQELALLAGHMIVEYSVKVNVYTFKGEVSKTIEKVYPTMNAIAMIAGLNQGKSKKFHFTSGKITTDYRFLRIPVIVVREELPRKTIYQNIVVPLDFNKESKEKTAWPGYMSTLNKSSVSILVRNYKDAYFAAALRNNLALVTKLYENLGVSYKIVKEPDITCDIDKYAVEYAWMNRSDLIVIIATKEIEIDDFLFGLREKKIIENKYNLPVMMINPREDLFLPCGC
jgi:hypothetical protein